MEETRLDEFDAIKLYNEKLFWKYISAVTMFLLSVMNK